MSEGGDESMLGMKKPAAKPASVAVWQQLGGTSTSHGAGAAAAAAAAAAAVSPARPSIRTNGKNDSQGIPNFQEMLLSMLANNNNKADNNNNTSSSSLSQPDFAAALSRHIRRTQQQQKKSSDNERKRKAPPNENNVIELDESSSSTSDDDGEGEPSTSNKRMRLEEDTRKPPPPHDSTQQDASTADDKFIDEFYENELGMAHADLDELIVMGKGHDDEESQQQQQQPLPASIATAHRVSSPSPPNTADAQQHALEQQKEVMFKWFSERLNDLESTIQTIFTEKAKEASEAKAKTQRLEKQNQELNEKLQKLLEVEEIDHVRKAQREYQPARAKVRELLLSSVPKTERHAYIECTELLSDEIKKYATYSTAVQEQMMMLQCRTFSEKSADQNTIAMLEARLEAAKEQALAQSTTTNDQDNTATSEQVRHLEQQLAESNQAEAYFREQETRLITSNHNLQKTIDEKHAENYELQRQLQETAYQKTQVEQHVNSVQSQIEMLKLNTSKQIQAQAVLIQRMNTDNNIRATQANANMQQVVNLSSMTAQQAAALEAQCNTTLREKEKAHENEMRKVIKDHMGKMRAQNYRVEQMADKLKNLCALNQVLAARNQKFRRQISKNEETNQQMAFTISRLSSARNSSVEQNGNTITSRRSADRHGIFIVPPSAEQNGNTVVSRSANQDGNNILARSVDQSEQSMSRSAEQEDENNSMSRIVGQHGNNGTSSSEDQDGNNGTSSIADQDGNNILSRSVNENGNISMPRVADGNEDGIIMSTIAEENGNQNGDTGMHTDANILLSAEQNGDENGDISTGMPMSAEQIGNQNRDTSPDVELLNGTTMPSSIEDQNGNIISTSAEQDGGAKPELTYHENGDISMDLEW